MKKFYILCAIILTMAGNQAIASGFDKDKPETLTRDTLKNWKYFLNTALESEKNKELKELLNETIIGIDLSINNCQKNLPNCNKVIDTTRDSLTRYMNKKAAMPVAAKRPLPAVPNDNNRLSMEQPKEQAPLPPAKATSRTKFPVKEAPSKPSPSDIPEKFKKK